MATTAKPLMSNECCVCGAANPHVLGEKKPETCASCGSRYGAPMRPLDGVYNKPVFKKPCPRDSKR